MSEMQAAVARDGKLELGRRPRPEPGPGEARVRLLACGVCGTDLHFFHGGLWPDGHTPGHEAMGEVESLGDGVTGLATGDRVAVEPLLPCGRCATCRAGLYNVCPTLRLCGIHVPGGFAEYLCMPVERLHPVSSDLAPEIAALAEPIAVGVHGLRRVGLAAGERVLVLGAGAVGLLGLVAAKALGAGDVWITARHAHQAERARALGADRVLSEAEATSEALAAQANEALIDVALETVGGTADTLDSAVAGIRPGGRISVVGLFQGAVQLPPLPLLLKEGTLAWSNCYAHGPSQTDFADAIEILENQRAQIEPVVTHTRSLDAVGEAFATAADKASGAVKVSVRLD